MNRGASRVVAEDAHCGSRPAEQAGLRCREGTTEFFASADSTSSAGSPQELRERIPATSVRKRQVLLVDDSPAYRRALRLVIEGLGDIDVAEARSGEEALLILPQIMPQLVFMDIDLPGIDGIEATSRVLESAPATVVIGLSVHTDDQVQEAILKAGALTLLNKESGIATVLALVEQYV